MKSSNLLIVILALGAISANAEEKSVYKSEFDRGVGRKKWSDTRSFPTRIDGERALGPFFSVDSTSLSLVGLPDHSMVRVRCKVYFLDTMDGGNPDEYDAWSVGVVGGQTLLHSSFDNKWSAKLLEAIDVPQRAQSYPDEFSAARNEEQTGADEVGALGFDGKGRYEIATYAVGYHLDLVFPHDGKDLALRFGGSLTKKRDESWALDDVEISVFDAVPVEEGVLAEQWATLQGEDSELANSALWKLLEAGDAGIDYAVERVTKTAEEREKFARGRREKFEKEFLESFERLKSDVFVDRIKASSEITKMGPRVKPMVEKELEGEIDPETRRLLLGVLARFADVAPEEAEEDREKVARSRIRHFLRVANTAASKGALQKMLKSEQALGRALEPFVLAGVEAVYEGPGWDFKYDADRDCWKKWVLPVNSLLWYAPPIAIGEYEVILECATGDGTGGDQFEFIAAGQVLSGVVPKMVKGEKKDAVEEFQKVTLGRILISNEGRYNFFIRPRALRGRQLMELRGIELKPVSAEE